MAVLKIGLRERDVLVLVDPDETRVLETFLVKSFSDDREIMVEDSIGRVFQNDVRAGVWIHPFVVLKFPEENAVKLTSRGYVSQTFVYIERGYKVHFANFLKYNKPVLFNQLPFNIKRSM